MEPTSDESMSALLERILVVLKCEPDSFAPRRYRVSAWLWRRVIAGRINPWLSLSAGVMSLMHSVFSANNLREACVGFMDASTMFLCAAFQQFAAKEQAETVRVLSGLLDLTRPMEAVSNNACGHSDQDGTEARRLRSESYDAARWLRWLVRASSVTVAGGVTALVTTPFLTSKLTFTAWPVPHPGSWHWWGVSAVQSVSSFTAGASLAAIMAFVLAAVCSAAALARAVATRTRYCRSEASVARVVQAHQAVLKASAAASRHVNAVLLPMVYGYLAVSLIGTFNLAAGRLDPYAAIVVPACLLFLFFFAVIGDVLDSSLQCVGDQAARVEVDWFHPSHGNGVSARAARRLLLPLMVRCRRPGSASVRVAWLGPLRLHSFMGVMKRWYSALQMMRSIK